MTAHKTVIKPEPKIKAKTRWVEKRGQPTQTHIEEDLSEKINQKQR